MATDAKLTLDTLSWGRGPRRFEMFLEPTCPHSGRAFGKIRPLLAAVGEDRLTVRIVIQSQPWHLFSAVVCRSVLAAATMDGGKETAWRAMERIYEHREDFVCIDHCSGPNLDVSLSGIVQRIEALTGLDLGAAFARKEVTDAIKLNARYARQNGIHVSPTFMVDGLVNDHLGSRDEIETWVEAIGL